MLDIYFMTLNELEFSQQILVKQPDITLHKNSPVRIEISRAKTDRRS